MSAIKKLIERLAWARKADTWLDSDEELALADAAKAELKELEASQAIESGWYERSVKAEAQLAERARADAELREAWERHGADVLAGPLDGAFARWSVKGGGK